MHVTSLRYRYTSQETWNFLRFPTGTGDLKNLQIIEADSKTLEPILEAFNFALLGKAPSHPSEVVLQLHDDDGISWSILRKPGSLRMTREGEVLDTQLAFAQMLQSIGITANHQFDLEKDKIKLFNPQHLAIESNRLTLWPLGESEPANIGIGRHLRVKIQNHLESIQKILDKGNTISLSQAIRINDQLEPIYKKYIDSEQKCSRWSLEQNQVSKEFVKSALHETKQNTFKFAKELSLMAEIQKIVAPLTGPQSPSLPSLQKQKTQLDNQLETIEKVIGPIENTYTDIPDFNQALDILCRLKAYGKLVKSTQELRDYCESNIDPQVKSYLEQSETLGSHLREFLESLQVDQLKIQRQSEILVPKDHETNQIKESPSVGKNWFDRFKTPTKPSSQDSSPPAHMKDSPRDLISDHIERIATTLEKIIVKGSAILAELPQQENHHENLKQAFDFSIDQLVQNLSKVRQEWLTLAKTLRLPESLEIQNLIKYMILFERSMVLRERRDHINSQIIDYQDKILRLEKLIIQWRKVTESQKQNPLDQTQLVIEEALSITRYLESKIKRFDQVLVQYADHNIKGQVLEIILAQYTAEKNQLMIPWEEEVKKLNISNLLINHPMIPEILINAHRIKQYWQILQETTLDIPNKTTASSLVEIWKLTHDHGDSKQLLEHFLGSSPTTSIILACPNASLNAKLSALGASIGTLTSRQAQPQSPEMPQHAIPSTLKPTPTVKKPTVGPQPTPVNSKTLPGPTSSSETLQARAERVLAMLGPRDLHPRRS